MAYWYKRVKGDGGFGANEYEVTTPVNTCLPIYNNACQYRHCHIDRNGILRILPGFVWDGPSGPTHDDEWNMKASLIHDAGYALIRDGGLPKKYRKHIDWAFYRHLRRAVPRRAPWYTRLGYEFRAAYYWAAVRVAGGRYV